MAYNEKLANRIREALSHLSAVEEKKMFKGITFMVAGKMCLGASGYELMCRIDPAVHSAALRKKGARTMEMNGKEYIGYIYVRDEGIKTKKNFEYWIQLALEYNKKLGEDPATKG